MRSSFRAAWLGVAWLLATAPASANFMASDLIYIPVAAHNEGLEGSVWRTDVYITNVDEVAVDVSLYFFPSGLLNNSGYLSRSFGAGGREEYGFASTDERLADIQPNGTALITDVVGEYWVEDFASSANLGAIAVFAYEAGTLDSPDGRVLRNVVVHTRTYNDTTIWQPDPDNEGEFIEVAASYGQTIPGVPWQNLADVEAQNELGDFTFFVLQGAGEDEVNRFNLGIFNTSDRQTTINLTIDPYQPDGSPYVNEDGNPLSLFVNLPPLAHNQYNSILNTIFAVEEAAGAMIKVSFVGWSSSSTNPIPTFTAYGSLVDGRTNDSTTFLPTFAFPYNVDCMWPGPGEGKAATLKQRPIDIPPR